jgi:hypothetical protein
VIGHYWTDRETAGEMELGNRQKKSFQTFESARAYFRQLPVLQSSQSSSPQIPGASQVETERIKKEITEPKK